MFVLGLLICFVVCRFTTNDLRAGAVFHASGAGLYLKHGLPDLITHLLLGDVHIREQAIYFTER